MSRQALPTGRISLCRVEPGRHERKLTEADP